MRPHIEERLARLAQSRDDNFRKWSLTTVSTLAGLNQAARRSISRVDFEILPHCIVSRELLHRHFPSAEPRSLEIALYCYVRNHHEIFLICGRTLKLYPRSWPAHSEGQSAQALATVGCFLVWKRRRDLRRTHAENSCKFASPERTVHAYRLFFPRLACGQVSKR